MAGPMHLGVKLMKGDNGIFETYKASAYAVALYPIYIIINAVIGMMLLIFILVGLGVVANFLMLFSALAINALMSLHISIVTLIGLAKLQDLDYAKAFLAIIIGGFVVGVILGIFALAGVGIVGVLL
jgi:hypothetical protein